MTRPTVDHCYFHDPEVIKTALTLLLGCYDIAGVQVVVRNNQTQFETNGILMELIQVFCEYFSQQLMPQRGIIWLHATICASILEMNWILQESRGRLVFEGFGMMTWFRGGILAPNHWTQIQYLLYLQAARERAGNYHGYRTSWGKPSGFHVL